MIRIGIVGCGRILAAHLRGYRLLREAGVDDFRITALCARKPDDARMYLTRGGHPPQRSAVSRMEGDPLAIGDEYLSDFQDDVPVAVYTDFGRMIAEAEVDAVNDFSTHALHHLVARDAFAHGKDLLTQKPLGVSIAAAREMCETSQAHDRVFGVFENFRYAPATRHMKWLVESGRLGAMQMILVGYVGKWWAPDRIAAETPWRHRLDEGGGISLDLGVHFFDQIRHVAGEITAVTAHTAILEPSRVTLDSSGNETERIACDADDTFVAVAETALGALAQLSASWGGHAGGTTFGSGVVWYGDQGRIEGDTVTFDDGTSESLADLYARHASDAQRQHDFPLGLSDSFALNQLDWLESIRHRRQPETSGREGLADLAAAYAILESAHAHRRVEVDEVHSGRLRKYQEPIDRRFGFA